MYCYITQHGLQRYGIKIVPAFHRCKSGRSCVEAPDCKRYSYRESMVRKCCIVESKKYTYIVCTIVSNDNICRIILVKISNCTVLYFLIVSLVESSNKLMWFWLKTKMMFILVLYSIYSYKNKPLEDFFGRKNVINLLFRQLNSLISYNTS
jgi:hypothetical protein